MADKLDHAFATLLEHGLDLEDDTYPELQEDDPPAVDEDEDYTEWFSDWEVTDAA